MSSELRARWSQAGGKIPEHWDIVTLESLLKDSKSIAVGVMYPGPDTEGGTPLIKVGDIKGGIIAETPAYRISSEVNQEHKRTQLLGDELLITLVGNPGECVVVTQSMIGWNPARAIAVVRLANPNLRVYLKTVLESSAGKHLIDAVLNTTVQKTLNLKDIRQLPIPMPSIETITAISSFSEALAARIALLRETNTTLEAIAQALFKSWFVDFDPVHANAGTQAPSLPAEIQALFPSRLVESAQGLIPEGWEFKKFSDVIDKYIDNRGKTPPTVDEGIPLLEIKHLPENEISPSVNTDKKVSQETYDTWFRAHPMKNDILMSTVGTIGRLSIMGNQRVAIAQNILGLRVGGVVAPEYMYYLMKDNKFKSDVNARLVVTVQASIKRKDLNTIDVLVPSKAAQSLFIDTVSQLIEKQRLNDEQAQNLANLRDTLLPRLISGQLRLPEAEAALAEVG